MLLIGLSCQSVLLSLTSCLLPGSPDLLCAKLWERFAGVMFTSVFEWLFVLTSGTRLYPCGVWSQMWPDNTNACMLFCDQTTPMHACSFVTRQHQCMYATALVLSSHKRTVIFWQKAWTALQLALGSSCVMQAPPVTRLLLSSCLAGSSQPRYDASEYTTDWFPLWNVVHQMSSCHTSELQSLIVCTLFWILLR